MDTVVETARGKLRGRTSQGVTTFKGSLTPHRRSGRTACNLRGLLKPGTVCAMRCLWTQVAAGSLSAWSR
jgi:hypothetical protein